jgi:hypothetical protein
MPFNGAGVFQRVRNWVADAAAGIKIRADFHDAEDDGFADGLTNCITKDGQTIVTQNIPWNSKRITGLADPVNPQDAATMAYADTKLSKTGGTINGDLDVAGKISAFGYRTRKGVAGPYGPNFFNFDWTGNIEAWIDDTNVGTLATQAYVNGQDAAIQAALQAQIDTKQANLGFTPVQQGGGTAQLTNKVYIGWSAIGLKAQVDSTDLGAITFGGVRDGRLAFAGDWQMPYDGSTVEPFTGAVATGAMGVTLGGPTYVFQRMRMRYMQLLTTSWYTVGYTA